MKFGYTDIRSNSVSAISNNYQNIDELRRELQGKTVSAQTINAAMKKVNFAKYGVATVHSFYPDAGRAYVGCNGHAAVVISWDVTKCNERYNENSNLTLLCENVNQIKQSLFNIANLVARKPGDWGWTTTEITFPPETYTFPGCSKSAVK
jgi:hypothetical protein